MSQQHGVSSSLASIEAAPPIHGTQTTSSISHSHPSTSSSGSSTPQTSSSGRSGNTSSRVHIPKLSAATTELLARLAGNIRGTEQQVLSKDDCRTRVNGSPFPLNSSRNSQSANSRHAGTMRVSSTFIELPTAPFEYPARVEAPVGNPSPVLPPSLSSNGLDRTSTKLNGLTSVASKPAVPFTSSIPASAGPQGLPTTQVSSDRRCPSIGTNGISAKPVDIAPKPAATHPTSTQVPASLQVPANLQPTPQSQPLSVKSTNEPSANVHRPINVAPRPAVTLMPATLRSHEQAYAQLPSNQPPLSNGTNGTSTRPGVSVNIAPKPRLNSLSSVTASGPQLSHAIPLLPGQASLPPPIVPLARAPTILKLTNGSLSRFPSGVPSKVPPTLNQRRSLGSRKSGSKKRKRGHDSDGEDIIRAVDSSSDESDITPTATQTISGRQVKRPSIYVPSPLSPALPKEGNSLAGVSEKPSESIKPRKRVPRKGKNTNITCTYCQRGHSLATNTIVFCDGCNRAWHQYCHDPPIENDVITVKEKQWFCHECKPVDITVCHPTVVRSDPSLTTKPPVHPPLRIPRTEVGAELYPKDDRRRFLSTLSHATLVELLLTISEKNPAVPMYPGNMATLPLSNFAPTQAIVGAGAGTPTPLPSDSLNPPITSEKGQNGQPISSLALERTRNDESSDDDSEYEFHEHRLYPRAGNGARLSNNKEDLDILQEDPACATFSYALHGPALGVTGNVSA